MEVDVEVLGWTVMMSVTVTTTWGAWTVSDLDCGEGGKSVRRVCS
jgi:hypothetical protein